MWKNIVTSKIKTRNTKKGKTNWNDFVNLEKETKISIEIKYYYSLPDEALI